MQSQIATPDPNTLDAIEAAFDACYEAEAAANMLGNHLAPRIAEDALQRFAYALKPGNRIQEVDEDTPPEPYLIGRIAQRVAALSDALAELMVESNGSICAEPVNADLMGLSAASTFLSLHPGSLRRLASDGRVPCRKVGREWRFSRTAILGWLASTPTEAAAQARDRDRMNLDAVSASFVRRAIRQPTR